MARKKKSSEAATADWQFDPAASRTQWLKGVLELCLLATVGKGEVYGYEIGQQLEAAGLGKIKGGTLYPRLAALEADGLVEIEWRVGEHGPGRKYYRITELGQAALAQSVAEYANFTSAVGDLLQPGGDGKGSNQRTKAANNQTRITEAAS